MVTGVLSVEGLFGGQRATGAAAVPGSTGGGVMPLGGGLRDAIAAAHPQALAWAFATLFIAGFTNAVREPDPAATAEEQRLTARLRQYR